MTPNAAEMQDDTPRRSGPVDDGPRGPSPLPSRLAARILDANANRASEALRVVEDYLRLGINHQLLGSECKSLRHDLAELLASLPSVWQARDVEGDVGRTVTTPQEYVRHSEQAVVIANVKRVQQALRSLEEWAKTSAPPVAAGLERLRYRAYQLETSVRKCFHRKRLDHCWLCVLIDGAATREEFANRAEALVEAGVHVIQLRDKTLSASEIYDRATLLNRVIGSRETTLIINDRPDIAVAAQADGVHLGQDDLPIAAARRIVGEELAIGRSTHNLAHVRVAVAEGADYLGVGPVFPSQTKHFDTFPGIDFADAATHEASVPAFAIGGIQAANYKSLSERGIRRVAVGHAIWHATDIANACRQFLKLATCLAAFCISFWPNTCRAQTILPVGTAARGAHEKNACLCELEKKEVVESSGLAAGRRNEGILWTHNDSGDEARIFAFDLKGKHKGTSHLKGAIAEDWEDMGAFTWKGAHYLFVADVGDNRRDRDRCTIYVAVEPDSPKKDVRARGIDFVYESGALDCEAVAFDPLSKSFLLVEKGVTLNSRVFQLKWPNRERDASKPSRVQSTAPKSKLNANTAKNPPSTQGPAKNGVSVARLIGTVPVPIVTGMDISPDGLRMALTTYGNGYEITRSESEPWTTAIKRQGRMLKFPQRRQGEAICYSVTGDTIFLTSEKKPCPLFAIPVTTDPLMPHLKSRDRHDF